MTIILTSSSKTILMLPSMRMMLSQLRPKEAKKANLQTIKDNLVAMFIQSGVG